MESIWLYSMAQWGAEQAEIYTDELTSAFAFLADNPNAGTACEYIRTGYRKYPVIRHVVYYRAAKFGIEFIRILHDRMLVPKHF